MTSFLPQYNYHTVRQGIFVVFVYATKSIKLNILLPTLCASCAYANNFVTHVYITYIVMH